MMKERKKVLFLIAEMRNTISSSQYFDDDHKKRLIERLAQVEAEIFKKEGRFDVILAGIVDFGDALGKFGQKAKPLTDLMREIRGIVQKKSEGYEKLPPPEETKLLPAPSTEE
jgi:hypothetical protein